MKAIYKFNHFIRDYSEDGTKKIKLLFQKKNVDPLTKKLNTGSFNSLCEQ